MCGILRRSVRTNAFLLKLLADRRAVFNVMFARALAEHLPPSVPVIPNCVNPGFCSSDFRRNFSTKLKLNLGTMDVVLGRTSEQGSRQLLYAALGPDGKDGDHVRFMRGAYVSCVSVREPSDRELNALRQRLIEFH